MNLLFRKNFREGAAAKSVAGVGGSGASGGKLQAKANRSKRSRDVGMTQPEEIHYRTHLFFSPSRQSYDAREERCSAFAGASTSIAPSLLSQAHEVEAPQPLVDRRPSVSLLKWNGGSVRNESAVGNTKRMFPPMQMLPLRASTTTTTPNAARQVSFGGEYGGGTRGSAGNNSGERAGNVAGTSGSARSEPISLATLDRDCFIIPVNSVDRFLPAGIPLPPRSTADGSTKASSPLSVLEVSDPTLCILVHLMSPLEPVDPVTESPLSHPLLKQRTVAAELLHEVQQANTAVGGMLLANMEKSAEFPFIAYYMINTQQTDPANFYSGIRVSSLSKFEPKTLKYTAAHTLDLYSEVAAICRPPLVLATSEAGGFKKTQTPSTGYIISVFKVFEGDDGERFEKNWLYWTGARMLYRYLPRTAGLRRIALHKSTSVKGDKMYLLVCECAELLKDITSAAVLIPALRARLCGYTGLYRPIQAF